MPEINLCTSEGTHLPLDELNKAIETSIDIALEAGTAS
jgi:hypothetical protein